MIRILGYNYELYFGGGADTIDAFGRLHQKKLKIQLANDLCDQQLISTILHEIIEAINYHNELDINHNAIMSLEAGLYQVLIDAGVNLEILKNCIDNDEK